MYSNVDKLNGNTLDESSPVIQQPELRGDAYCYAKVKQEEIVERTEKSAVRYTIVRPGAVYGARKSDITGRVGINTFGFYLHLGGPNTIPFTYVDNCADAIVLAGLVAGVDGESFNVLDDDLPTSRQFLRQFKKNARSFRSVYVPHAASYAFCYLWERYSRWSEGQLPPVFTAKRWHGEWKKTRYSNAKLKSRLGWKTKITQKRACGATLKPAGEVRGMLRIAIAGCGKIADQHAQAIRRLSGCEIVAACDREPLMAEQFCERFKVPQAFTDLAEMLEKAKPDVVHITTPAETHFALAKLCMERNCHVYVEKPFTLYAEEARQLVELAAQKGVKLTVGHNYRFTHWRAALGRWWHPGI